MESLQSKEQKEMISALRKEQGRELAAFEHTMKEAQRLG